MAALGTWLGTRYDVLSTSLSTSYAMRRTADQSTGRAAASLGGDAQQAQAQESQGRRLGNCHVTCFDIRVQHDIVGVLKRGILT